MHDDTAIGGPHGRFPVTRISVIRGIGSTEPPLREAARELLVAAYWKPVYKHIRLKWNQSNEDAKDLTQSFFAHALEKDVFSGYDPDKAAFRTYVRTCLDRFIANQVQSAARLKRGGGMPGVPLDFEEAEAEFMRYGPAGPSVEELFDKEALRSVFEMALERVRIEFASRNPVQADLDDRSTSTMTGPAPSAIALRIRRGWTGVRTLVHRARLRIQAGRCREAQAA
ncbi:MAG: hypothetical protein U0Q18_30865 [Bryobacteraceae bacterium]